MGSNKALKENEKRRPRDKTGGKGKKSKEVLVQRRNMYVCINIGRTNNHHISLPTQVALLGDFVHGSVHQAGVNICTRTAIQPRIGAWTV